MSSKHQKHPKLERPRKGYYHRIEWGIYGTTCGAINAFIEDIQTALSNHRFLIVDADHNTTLEGAFIQIKEKKWTCAGSIYHNEYDDRILDWNTDAALVNGNHYPAERQIVFINPAKKESLKRRIEQLNQIDLILLPDADTEVYDFLLPKMTPETKILQESAKSEIHQFIAGQIKAHRPPLKALILAGGKSTRMGMDKSKISYHSELTQEEYLLQLCEKLNIPAYLSKAEVDQAYSNTPVILDRMMDMGPFGAILTAFMTDPNAAWLVLACDIPLLSQTSIQELIDERNPQKYATCYQIEGKPFPEPLIAIYEPRIYQRMLRFLSMGYACPRKVLINSDVHRIMQRDQWELFNANTPAEREEILKKMKTH